MSSARPSLRAHQIPCAAGTPALPFSTCPVRRLLSFVFLLATPLAATASSLYGFVDDSGVAHFSDVADDRRYQRISGPAAGARKTGGGRAVPVNADLRARIARIAAEYGIAPALALALIEVESGFRSDARSPKGALGLMQLMPATAARYGVADPFDIDANLRGGMRYLCDLFAQFGGAELALAAYNAGEGAVIRHGYAIPPYAETRAYVPRILARHAELAGQPGLVQSDYRHPHSSCIR